MKLTSENLKKQIEDAICDALKGEVAEGVVKSLVRNAQTTVYDAYTPKPPEEGGYERRYTLIDPSNYEVSEPVADGNGNVSMTITPIAEFNRRYGGWNEGNELAGLMNYGNWWHGYVMNYSAPLPRPYLDIVVDNWNSYNLMQAISAALRKRGIPVDVIESATVTK